MYNQFFGVQKSPFNMTPDPGLVFMQQQHREALAGLVCAVLERKGFAVLIGDAGTGKTTLLARLLQHLRTARVQSSVILNPTVTTSEFLEMVLLDFGIADVPVSKAQRLARLQRLVLQGHAANRISLLVIDEAHKMTPELLEEVRLLGNFDLGDQKLLQIVLIGQDELGRLLNEPHLRQLKQRIAVRLSLGPVAKGDVGQYIRYRWTKCGGNPAVPFTEDAIDAIAKWSNGTARLINAICDNALTLAFGQGVRTVTSAHIHEVAKDLDLFPTDNHSAPEPVRITESVASPVTAASVAPIRVFEQTQVQMLKRSPFARLVGKLGLTGWNRQYE
ncbi:MAG TPA: AAA family ATPase [Bryobacteraceae bacterium]|nr:AAA family ATPase [Bryobacteraceae bacterium]